jgi:hypothetical protein
MKDMLVDLHSPVYQHLLAQANYNVDEHSYLKLTSYLQNLSLIEESFNKNKLHGNSEARTVHKAGKSFSKKKVSKLGKNQCRKHPHHEHTWADCWANPKNRNKKPTVSKGDKKEKAEARNADAMETDSEMEMDQAIEVLAIEDEEVRTTMVDLENVQPTPSSTNTMPLSPYTATVVKGSENKGSELRNTKISVQTENILPIVAKIRVMKLERKSFPYKRKQIHPVEGQTSERKTFPFIRKTFCSEKVPLTKRDIF